jgi:Fe-Mn family superoxide dismutase
MKKTAKDKPAELWTRKPHQVVTLPFPATSLKGISDRMISSHHDNNYVAAVKSLNKVREHIAALPADAPPFLVAGLRERELTFRNSAFLHEHYFENLGGNGRRGAGIEKALADGWNGAANWDAEFRAAAAGLAGGSGWVVLTLDLRTRALSNYWSGGHTQVPAGVWPILVLDMYEHAYQMDYGAAAAKYVEAFFRNVKWEIAEQRMEKGLQAAALLSV